MDAKHDFEWRKEQKGLLSIVSKNSGFHIYNNIINYFLYQTAMELYP